METRRFNLDRVFIFPASGTSSFEPTTQAYVDTRLSFKRLFEASWNTRLKLKPMPEARSRPPSKLDRLFNAHKKTPA